MKTRSNRGSRAASASQAWLRKAAVSTLAIQFLVGYQTTGALLDGTYQTLPSATVEEWGDRVPNRSRIVPILATFTFDLPASAPSLTAVIPNAVLEGGEPFWLTVHSSSWSQLPDGTNRFMGDYLRELYPSGTQYLFDWRFSTSTNGFLIWNGTTAWVGGHAWYVTITNLTLTPVPWLKIKHASNASVQVSWKTNFAGHVLEFTTNLAAQTWSEVTNIPNRGDELVWVTLEPGPSQQFYRLRRP